MLPGRVNLTGAGSGLELWELNLNRTFLLVDVKSRTRYAGPADTLIGLAEQVERDYEKILEVLED